MNERIRELSEQAEKYADDNFRGEPTWSEAFESRFAELIVKECSVIADQHNESKLSEDYTLGVGRAIKRYFGVE